MFGSFGGGTASVNLAELITTVAKIAPLRKEIDAIAVEIEDVDSKGVSA